MISDFTALSILGGVAAATAGFIFWHRVMIPRRQRGEAVSAIKQGHGVFLSWNYSPADWKFAAAEFFEIKPRRMAENGKASFTERFVFITNGADELLHELIGEDRYARHLTDVRLTQHSGHSVVRFEVRTKTIKKDDNGNDTMEEDYAVETFYVPVPRETPAEGEKVLNFYKEMLDRNADAVAAVMPMGLGMFK